MQLEGHSKIGESLGKFASKAAILLAMTAAALAAWTLREVIFIFFGALVLANGMNAVASFLAHRFRVRYSVGLLTVVAPGLAALGAVAWFFGATINDQLQELADKIPDYTDFVRIYRDDDPDGRRHAVALAKLLQQRNLHGDVVRL